MSLLQLNARVRVLWNLPDIRTATADTYWDLVRTFCGGCDFLVEGIVCDYSQYNVLVTWEKREAGQSNNVSKMENINMAEMRTLHPMLAPCSSFSSIPQMLAAHLLIQILVLKLLVPLLHQGAGRVAGEWAYKHTRLEGGCSQFVTGTRYAGTQLVPIRGP